MLVSSKIKIALAICMAAAVWMAIAASQPKPDAIDISMACHPSLSLVVQREIVKFANRGSGHSQFIGQDHLKFVNRSDDEYKFELRCIRVAHWSPQSVWYFSDDNVPKELSTGETITIPPRGSKTITCDSGGTISTKELNMFKKGKGAPNRLVLSFEQKTADPKQQPVGTLISDVIAYDAQSEKK